MDIEISHVKDKGDQEEERIFLKVNSDCNLNRYILFDSTFEDDEVSNKHRHSFFWKPYDVKQGDLVVVYSKEGKQGASPSLKDKTKTTHFFYWGMDEQTIWNKGGDRALLVHVDDFHSKNV